MTELKFDFNFTKYINSKFKHIVYQDDIHAYYNLELDTQLISVTQALKKFEPVFNKEYWLKTKARERGISVQELEKEWDTLKQEGCDKGTMYHNYIEKRFNREVFKNKIEVIENYLSQCTDISVANEIVVGNDILAGRFDNLSLRDDRLVLKDYKTNKKFATTSKHKLTNGLSHLPNTEFHKYSLQLSLYKYMLGIDCDMEVIWFNGDEYQIFEIPYLEKEVEIILNKLRNEDKGNNRWS